MQHSRANIETLWHESRALSPGRRLGLAAVFPQVHVEIRDKLRNKLPFMIFDLLRFPPPSPAHLSITARHSFLQVKRLPRRSRKVPGVVVRGGGVCLHSISSIGNGAGLMLRVAPEDEGSRVTSWLQLKTAHVSGRFKPPSAVGAVLRRVCGLEGQTVPVKVKSW